MTRDWTLISRKLHGIKGSSFLKAAFTVYSFVSLLLFAPAPALGSTLFDQLMPSREIASPTTPDLPGGGPAAREIGDRHSHCGALVAKD